jgi:hypothetical protein
LSIVRSAETRTHSRETLELGFNQQISKRIPHEVREIFQFEFHHQSRAMPFNRSDTYAELFSGALVRLAFG